MPTRCPLTMHVASVRTPFSCIYIYFLNGFDQLHHQLVGKTQNRLYKLSSISRTLSETSFCSVKMILPLIFLCCVFHLVSAQLRVGFYNSTCPQAETIVRQAVQNQFNSDRSITAALLRMHFHDCFVRVSVVLQVLLFLL